jgi:hypothetical protein
MTAPTGPLESQACAERRLRPGAFGRGDVQRPVPVAPVAPPEERGGVRPVRISGALAVPRLD